MTELEEPLLTTLLNRVVYPEAQRDSAKADDAAKRAAVPLQVLDGALAGRQYLLGGTFTTADLNVAAVAVWTKLPKIDLSATPHVAGWLDRCLGRPAFGRASKT